MTAVMSQLVVPLSLYSKKYLNFNEKEIGFLFTINGLIVILIQYFIGNTIKNEKLLSYISISCLFYAIGYFIFGYSYSYHIAVISIIIVTIGEVIFSPSLSTLVSYVSPGEKRGHYMGFHLMASDFGRSFGVFIGTFLIDKFALHFQQTSWYFISVIAIISSFGFLKLKKL